MPQQTQSSIFLLLFLPLLPESSYQSPRSSLLQQQVCSYQPFFKLLSCSCPQGGEGIRHGLKLQLGLNIREQGQEIKTVQIKGCNDLVLLLDLNSVNPSEISFQLKNCGTIRLEEVTFEPLYAGQQLLSLEVSTVLKFILDNLEIEETFKVNGSNIKEFLISDVTFSHIPENGLIFDTTDKLSITDSVFKRISPASITAVGSKDILILNNQFNINAVEVIKASKGSKLYISCNRLLDEPLNPECVTNLSTESPPPPTTDTTTESLPSEVYPPPEVSEKQIEESWVTAELVIGVTVGAVWSFCFSLL